jgi:iron complex transport system ATP-binding protein
LLDAKNLVYEIGGTRILDHVSIGVDEGHFVGLIGPNGSGKTTLLRLLDRVVLPTSGDIRLAGSDLSKLKSKEIARQVGYLGQEMVPAIGLPVLEILLMGRYPYLKGLADPGREDRELALRCLSYVGLPGFESRFFDELSTGEKQLALFAKILVQEPEVLLLDEPTSNLDIGHQDSIFSMAAELVREKKGVLAVIHNLNIAARYCSRLILLNRGAIAASGEPEAVLKPEILEPVYGVKCGISRNTATGAVTVSVMPRISGEKGVRIHLIGGAGSAVNLTRELLRLGFTLSGGIAHEADSDYQLWRNLDVPFDSVPAFSFIEDEDVERARALVNRADLTVLCSFPVGPANLGNLKLAFQASNLFILKPGRGELERTFFSGEAETLFRRLAELACPISHPDLINDLLREKK